MLVLLSGCGGGEPVPDSGATAERSAAEEENADRTSNRGSGVGATAEAGSTGNVDRRAARLLVKAEELHRRGRAEEALALTRRAAGIDPDLPQTYSLRARILEQQGDRGAAVAAYDSVLARDSTYEGAWQNRGNLLFRSGRFEEALASYRRAHRNEPRSDAIYLAGRAHARLGRPDSALSAYRRALQLDSANAQAWRWQAVLQGRRGAFEEAVASARRAVDIQPENPHFRFVLGRYLLQTNRPAEAVEHLRAAREHQHPDSVQVHRVWERARQRAGGSAPEASP